MSHQNTLQFECDLALCRKNEKYFVESIYIRFSFTDLTKKIVKIISFTQFSHMSLTQFGIWKSRKFTLTLFWHNFRETKVFDKEINAIYIWLI